MTPEMIGRLASGGISILVGVFGLLAAIGVVKLSKDPAEAEKKRQSFQILFWVVFVGGVLIGIARIAGLMPA